MSGRRATTDIRPGDLALSVGHPGTPCPPRWSWAKLSEVAEMATGHTPSRQHPEYWGGEIPWVSVRDARPANGQVITKAAETTNSLGIEKSAAVVLPAGTVCLSRTGSIGYSVILGHEMATSQGFVNWICGSAVVPRFLQLLFLAENPFLHRISEGVAHTTIYFPEAKAFYVCLPPVAEQHRIVEALDSYLSRLDAAQAALERVQTNLERYRASVLQAAVEGRLVPTEAELAKQDGRDYEPASALLERILIERRQKWEEAELAKLRAKGKEPKKDKWKAKYKEPVAPDASELPDLPEGWCWAAVDALASAIQYGTSAKTSAATSGGVPVLRMGNLVKGQIHAAELKYLPHDHAEFPALLLQQGDLLFNRTNSAELVGKSAVYCGAPAPCSFASYLIRVQFLNGVLPEFVAVEINSLQGRRWIAAVRNQQVGQANVNGTKLRQHVVPLPPATEQSRIITETDRLLSNAGATLGAAEAIVDKVRSLQQAILKWAFEGKLVDQDPNDEPASVLLERIRAERDTAAPKKGTRSRKKATA